MADRVALKSKRKLGDFRWGNSYSGPRRRTRERPKAVLFQTYSRATGQLTGNPLPQIAELKAAFRAEREEYMAGQKRDRDALTDSRRRNPSSMINA
jgi:hypothetical protein